MRPIPADPPLTPAPAMESAYAVVVPTIGRASLQRCIDALAHAEGPLPARVVVVDDRPDTPLPLPLTVPGELRDRLDVVMTSGGRGPAAARNAGWRAAPAVPWIVFVDDDVEVGPRWRRRLAADLRADPEVGGVQGLIEVPLPSGRAPTDAERNVAGLADARWITADMAYRRDALIETGGFDERFPRAYREDSDLALRVQEAGWRLAVGCRSARHPVSAGGRWASVRRQAGNADDALMTALHGPGWYERAGATRGRRSRHLAMTACGAGALLAAASGRRRTAAAAAGLWAAGTAEFAAARILPGPRTRTEISSMLVTSAVIPPVASAHWLRGRLRHRSAPAWPARPAAVLFDRDGTLIHDAPYNDDPEKVVPMPGAAAALQRLRAAGLRLGVVTNQSGVGRGLISETGLKQVNDRVEELLGPFDTWAVCPHTERDGCACRKPAPGLIEQAARDLGVDPSRCVVVGDIGDDLAAARAAGARSVLIPTPRTRAEELAGARLAADLPAAVAWILGHGTGAPHRNADVEAGS
jgi:histidinol-phosphate phosphatase family protein